MSPSTRRTQLPFFDILGVERQLDFRYHDGKCRLCSEDWLDLIEVLAHELNVPYATLLRHPKYGQSVEAVRDLMETGEYELPADPPPLGLRERRFAERRGRFERRAAAVSSKGYCAMPVTPRSAKRPWRLPELDMTTFRDYEPSSKSALGSFTEWPSPRVVLRRRHGLAPSSERGGSAEGAASPASASSAGLSRASGSPGEEGLACKREREREAGEGAAKRSRRESPSGEGSPAWGPGPCSSSASSPAPLSPASAASSDSGAPYCAPAPRRRPLPRPASPKAARSRGRSEALAGLSHTLSQLLSSHFAAA